MSLNQLDSGKIFSVINTVGLALVAWMASQFSDLPRKVTILETKEVIQKEQFDKMDVKLDKILARLPRQ